MPDELSSPPRGSWRCANCGEVHEPQFMACWNCGAGRPDDAAAPELEKVDPNAPLDVDLECVGCKYNLRGLLVRSRCPECGAPVIRSVLERANDIWMDMDDPVPRRLMEAAVSGLGYPIDGAIFLLRAWSHVVSVIAPVPRESVRMAAIRMCCLIADDALRQYVTLIDALRTLRACKINDCHALGVSLFTLIAHGLIAPIDWLTADDFVAEPIEAVFPPRRISDVQI
jgi:hypothetical protein